MGVLPDVRRRGLRGQVQLPGDRRVVQRKTREGRGGRSCADVKENVLERNARMDTDRKIADFRVKQQMKKLFISQPMQGKSKEEILAERKVAICQAKEAVGDEVEIIDSYFENAPACNRPLWFLGESLKLLATADIAYFAAGWEGARGCKIEHTCAEEYGVRIIETPGM